MMLSRFYPGSFADSAYEIPYSAYFKKGIRGILFDIDNTLVPHGAPADARAVALFERLRREGFRTCLLSNNREERVAPFARAVGSDFVSKAGKPGISGYRRGMERMETTAATTLFVGDQLFTDVYGANRAGIRSILVKPIHPREEIQIVIKRRLERPVLWICRKTGAARQEEWETGEDK